MPSKKTPDEYRQEFYSLGRQIELLSDYTGSKNTVKVKCLTCGNIWEPNAYTILKHGCGECGRKSRGPKIRDKKTLPGNVFYDRVAKLGEGKYELLTEYVAAKKKVRMLHIECGTVYDVTPSDFSSGRRCPHCGSINRHLNKRKTSKEFEEQVSNISNSDYILLSKYTTWDTPVIMKHIFCGETFSITPNSFLQGRRCSNCSKSYGEQLVKEVLDLFSVNYIQQKHFEGLVSRKGNLLSYDFFIPELNVLIEYQGKQHYQPIKYFGGEDAYSSQKYNDKEKYNFAKENKYKLVAIKYTNYSKDSITNILKPILDLCNTEGTLPQ